ncbi:MAG TPA: peroxide stress protein YaaA [Baekduia sp.]|nr:peroxide stress protein YaaA [Baekduia sp.]
MLVLLPPSEGKRAPESGAPVDVGSLAFATALGAKREKALTALIKLAGGRSRKRALDLLGLPPGLSGELDRDATLRDAPTAPAGEVYTGVLFQHLDLATLPPAAVARAHEQVLVASALWGVVALDDHIPAYRLSISARLPSLTKSGLAAFWRPALTAALPDEPGDLVIDMRSGGYAAAWRPRQSTLVEVKASTADGRPISHMAKAVRGTVTRELLRTRHTATTPEDVAAAAEKGDGVGRVELHTAAKPGGAHIVNVVAAA